MLKPRNKLVRYCAACSSAIPVHEEACPHCSRVLALALGPGERETEQILSGRILYNGEWVSISEKIQRERQVAQQLAAGLVEHNGQWIKIEEKSKLQKDLARDPEDRIVDFPITAKREMREREATPSVRRQRNQRRIVVVALSVCSFLTMAFALIGILISTH